MGYGGLDALEPIRLEIQGLSHLVQRMATHTGTTAGQRFAGKS
jgi:hypothetical protein